MNSNQHELLTTVVGSYPVPDWLKSHHDPGVLNDAIALVMRAHERAGIDVISDGEISRWDLRRGMVGGMVERFVLSLSGIEPVLSRVQREQFESRQETRYRRTAPGIVVDAIGEGSMDLTAEWRHLRSMTERSLKFTITSPYMLAKVVADEFYGDIGKLAMAFADILAKQVAAIDADVLQIDEPHLPGHSDESPLAANAINHVLDAAGSARSKAVHLCFGNYGGQTIQQGHYRQLIGFLNDLHCDHVVLETTRRSDAETDQLKEVKPEIQLGLGVIDVKDLQVESAEQVARRVESFGNRFGVERIRYIHPDCGMQHLPRTVADAKLLALVEGRDLAVGIQNNS